MRRLIVAAATAAALLVPATGAQASAVGDQSRVCIAPWVLGQCLETIICGAPHDVAVRLGIDEYIDPQITCVH